jgi:hypothetical protein
MSKTTTCGVCCEKYNKSTHSKIICEFAGCGYEACKICIRTYLLGTTNDPHCMNCKNQWTNKFLVESLNRSYIDNDYKKHRKNLLVEREISRTPELMVLVERTKLIEEEYRELALIEEEYEKMRKMLNEKRNIIAEKQGRIYRIKNGEDAEKDERKKFIMPCPGNDCKGYLSSQYKCQLCKLFVCPDCFEIIGYTKEEVHACKEDNLKSAELIKKETKGCPQCGVRIFKISGCDQMWCTECKVAFSWTSGKVILNAVIHNPHFYQYMQNNSSGGVAPRNPGDVLCGGLLVHANLRLIQSHLNNINKKMVMIYVMPAKKLEFENHLNSNVVVRDFVNNLKSYFETPYPHILTFNSILNNLHQFINHITNVDLEQCRRRVRDLMNHDALTVQYILNRRTKEDLANTIFRNDNIRKKNVELLNVYELLSVVGIERFNELYEYFKTISGCNDKLTIQFLHQIVNFVNEYNQLIKYCNNQLISISYTYGMTVTTIVYEDYSYATQTRKFTQAELMKTKEKGEKGEKNSVSVSQASCSYIDN